MIGEILYGIIRTLVLPPISLLSLALAGHLMKSWYPRIGRSLTRSSLALLFVMSTFAGAWLLTAPLENLEEPLLKPKDAGAQAIVVLSAGTIDDNPEYNDKAAPDYVALARIRYAAKLYRDTGLPILVSGGGGDESKNQDSLASSMAHVLEYEFAIPVKWQEDQSKNTLENARFSARILKQAGITHILLVTDAMHMRRAKYSFNNTGIKVTSAPTLFLSSGGLGLSVLSYLPSAEGLRRSYYATYEWIGLVWYWMLK